MPNVIVTAGAVLSIRGSGAAGRDIAVTSMACAAGYEIISRNAYCDGKVARMVGGQPQGDTWNVLHRSVERKFHFVWKWTLQCTRDYSVLLKKWH